MINYFFPKKTPLFLALLLFVIYAFLNNVVLANAPSYSVKSAFNNLTKSEQEEYAHKKLFLSKLSKSTPKLRIISISPEITELIKELNAQDLLVGVDINSNLPSKYNTLPKIADFYHIYQEKVLALQPNLIIGTKNYNMLALKKLSIKKDKLLLLNFNSINDLYLSLDLLGTLLGEKANLADKTKQISTTIEHEKALNKASLKNKSIVIAIWPKPITVIGKNSIINELLSICQAHNPYSDYPVPFVSQSIEALHTKKIDLLLNASDHEINIPNITTYKLPKDISDIINKVSTKTIIFGLPKLCEIIRTNS